MTPPAPGGPPAVDVAWLGRVPYLDALERQRARREAVLTGDAPDTLWLLEHDPVITTGRRHVDLDEAALAAAGLPVVRTERGGLTTWHGPGQLVGYVIVDLDRLGIGVKACVRALEAGVIAWLADRGVPAGRRDGYPGVWIGHDKVCAVGIHVRQGVTLHGFALNLRVDLEGFSRIVPCGITDGGVASLHARWPTAPSPEAAAAGVGSAVVAALHAPVDR